MPDIEVAPAPLTMSESKSRFEQWFAQKLGDELVAGDLEEKNALLCDSAFVFLRGSYWRWAESILDICPEIADAPEVLAVGDIHLENFGTWRDVDGRLVWGVNDFDEAAEMPYTVDLVRLATSMALAEDTRKGRMETACAALLKGYQAGLAAPGPILLERDWEWLREAVVVPEDRRYKFWKRLDAREEEEAPAEVRSALAAAMPRGVETFVTARRVAGTGSLGRPRWIGVADWRGGQIVREAKRLLPSGWQLAKGHGDAAILARDIALGKYRAPDPWYDVTGTIVVRRLSPNNRKVEVEKRPGFLLTSEMHAAMGQELANIHLGTGVAADVILADLEKRRRKWLLAAAEQAAKAVTSDYKQWKKLAVNVRQAA